MWYKPFTQTRNDTESTIGQTLQVLSSGRTDRQARKELRKLKSNYPHYFISSGSASTYSYGFTTIWAVAASSDPRNQASRVELVLTGQTRESIAFQKTLETDTAFLLDPVHKSLCTLIGTAKEFLLQMVYCILTQARWLLHTHCSDWLWWQGQSNNMRTYSWRLHRSFNSPITYIGQPPMIIVHIFLMVCGGRLSAASPTEHKRRECYKQHLTWQWPQKSSKRPKSGPD